MKPRQEAYSYNDTVKSHLEEKWGEIMRFILVVVGAVDSILCILYKNYTKIPSKELDN